MPDQQPDITLKEVFERVVALEARIEGAQSNGKRATFRFGVLMSMILLSILLDILLHVYLHVISIGGL